MRDARFRVLLDQGFPAPPGFDPRHFDDTVEHVRLFDFDRKLSEESTPDWKIVLLASQAGFDALVSDDAAMLEEDITLTALCLTDLSLVTWEGGMSDPVTRWAQLLAYTPEIRRHLRAGRPPAIFHLPSVRLRKIDRARDLIDARASRAGRTGQEVRAGQRRAIFAKLRENDPTGLADLLRSRRM